MIVIPPEYVSVIINSECHDDAIPVESFAIKQKIRKKQSKFSVRILNVRAALGRKGSEFLVRDGTSSVWVYEDDIAPNKDYAAAFDRWCSMKPRKKTVV